MESPWEPADELERDLAAALERGDGRRFAALLLSMPLFLPVLPERDSEMRRELDERFILDENHVLVFTSRAAAARILGDQHQECTETTLAAIVEQAPEPSRVLALNPGLPIGALVPLPAVAQLAQGHGHLMSGKDFGEAVRDEFHAQLRQACLAELGDGTAPDGAGKPANEFEEALIAAIERQDTDAFLEALIGADVVVPTSQDVSDFSKLGPGEFPWRTVGPAIPVFSSPDLADRLAPRARHRAELPFLAVLAFWPGEGHVLCFNPGVRTELVLSADHVGELLEAVGESLPDR